MYKVFSKGLCQSHWRQQYGKPLKRQSEKQKIKKEKKKEILEDDKFFYISIWNTKFPHACYNCGQFLGYSPYNWMFHHILHKNKYPEFRYEKKNICYLCLTCHDNETMGNLNQKMKELLIDTQKKLLHE